ncbi:MAG: hypothetical protein ACUVUC_09310, partial [Thermoguttaceae bacterium]
MGAQVNPLDPTQAFVLGNICQLDWEKGLWRVTGTLHRPTSPEDLFSLCIEGQKMDVRRMGKRTLLLASSSQMLIVCELGADTAQPLAAMRDIRALTFAGSSWPHVSAWPRIVLKNLAADPR